MRRFWITGLGVTAVALGCLTGCVGGQADSPAVLESPVPDANPTTAPVPSGTAPIQYGISYTIGPQEYDERESQPAFDACAALPGSSFAGADESLPPGLSVRFVGTDSEQADLVACLRALPDTRLSGPFDVSDNS